MAASIWPGRPPTWWGCPNSGRRTAIDQDLFVPAPQIADARRRLRHVFVRDLDLEAVIGVHRHEKRAKQPVRINLDLTVAEDLAPLEDDLGRVVCYESLVDAIKALLARGHVNLVETLAEQIAACCLADPRILSARVRVEKPWAIAEARSVGIEIERTRMAGTS